MALFLSGSLNCWREILCRDRHMLLERGQYWRKKMRRENAPMRGLTVGRRRDSSSECELLSVGIVSSHCCHMLRQAGDDRYPHTEGLQKRQLLRGEGKTEVPSVRRTDNRAAWRLTKCKVSSHDCANSTEFSAKNKDCVCVSVRVCVCVSLLFG